MNPPPLPVRKRFPWIIYWMVLAFIVLVALAPVGSVVACGVIANAHGCRVDEGSVHPCIINGKDYGQMLYTLGVLGWLMLVPFPRAQSHFTLVSRFAVASEAPGANAPRCSARLRFEKHTDGRQTPFIGVRSAGAVGGGDLFPESC